MLKRPDESESEFHMSLGSIAALIAAIALVILVVLIGVFLYSAGRVLNELRLAVRDTGHGIVPILTELRQTVVETNNELSKIALVTEDASKVSANATIVSEQAAQMSQLFSATLGGPLVKTAALTHGVRRAFSGKSQTRKAK